jgi:hypothetical protein
VIGTSLNTGYHFGPSKTVDCRVSFRLSKPDNCSEFTATKHSNTRRAHSVPQSWIYVSLYHRSEIFCIGGMKAAVSESVAASWAILIPR